MSALSVNAPVITLIAAMDQARGIGKGGQLPWRMPSDLRRFRARTLGRACIMGRLTYESLPAPLAGRRNLVVSRGARDGAGTFTGGRGAEWFTSLEAAIEAAGQDAVVIGGGQIYEQALAWASWAELTTIHGTFDCDTYMPELPGHWKLVERSDHWSPEDSHASTWTRWQRTEEAGNASIPLSRGVKTPRVQ